MGTMTTLSGARDITRAELDAMPEDGRRHELIDGALIVTPAPALRHQRASARLTVLLSNRCPDALEVLAAPFDVVLAEDTVVEPDLLVARKEDLTERDLPGVPLLALEILSPSTRHIDLHLKRARYEAAGCASYWVVDPAVPSITAWELRRGTYVEVAHAVADETVELHQPFDVTITPDDLVR